MAVNKALVVSGCLVVFGVAAWMVLSTSDVPVIQDPVEQSEKAAKNTSSAKKDETVTVAISLKQNPADLEALEKQRQRAERHLIVPQENLSILYIVKCSACHGRDGKGPIGPSIAGKDFNKNLELLKKYKANEVENTMMEDMLTRTSDQELEMLAREVSSFK